MTSDRRENIRFTLPPEQRRAKLKTGGGKFAAEILEQSATGFRVQVPADSKIALDDVVTLDYWSGTCQAVVAYVEDVNKTRRLGLKRLSDDTPTPLSWLRFSCFQQAPGKPAKRGSGRPRLVAAGCLALALMLAGWLAFCLNKEVVVERPAAGSLAKHEPLAKHDSADESPRKPLDANEAKASDEKSAADARSSRASLSPPRGSAEPMTILQRLIALQSVEMAIELELSEQQKLEISRLLDEASRGLSRLQSRRGAKSAADRKEKIRALFSRTEARAENILSPRQRAKWLGEFSPRQQAEAQSTAMANSAAEN